MKSVFKLKQESSTFYTDKENILVEVHSKYYWCYYYIIYGPSAGTKKTVRNNGVFVLSVI